MAIQHILAIRDRAVDAFGVPIFVPAVGAAVRSFSDEINRPESPYAVHPEDYDLFHLGEYDAAAGAIRPYDKPRQVAIGKDLKRQT